MAAVATAPVSSLSNELRKQIREELRITGSENITNPEKFALEQKYGLTDPNLTPDEKFVIAQEEKRDKYTSEDL